METIPTDELVVAGRARCPNRAMDRVEITTAVAADDRIGTIRGLGRAAERHGTMAGGNGDATAAVQGNHARVVQGEAAAERHDTTTDQASAGIQGHAAVGQFRVVTAPAAMWPLCTALLAN